MTLADCAYTTSFQSFDLIAISCLEWGKHCYVARLKFVGGMRGKAAWDDIVVEAEL